MLQVPTSDRVAVDRVTSLWVNLNNMVYNSTKNMTVINITGKVACVEPNGEKGSMKLAPMVREKGSILDNASSSCQYKKSSNYINKCLINIERLN